MTQSNLQGRKGRIYAYIRGKKPAYHTEDSDGTDYGRRETVREQPWSGGNEINETLRGVDGTAPSVSCYGSTLTQETSVQG